MVKVEEKTIELERKNDFKEYVEEMLISDRLKLYIGNDIFIDKNPPIYLYYPEVFYAAFEPDSKKKQAEIRTLNIAGYFYYRSIMGMDSAIDNEVLPKGKQKEKHVLAIMCSICQEESIKLLTSLFQLDKKFWSKWNARRQEFLNAIIIDKQKREYISKEEFEKLADYKSSFGKIAIDSTFILSNSEDIELYNKLQSSHKFFSSGFQLIDDILDFDKDIINPQVNFAYQSLKEYFTKKNIDYSKFSDIRLNKYLYVSGIAESLIIESINYYNKALKVIEGHNIPRWNNFINNSIHSAKSMLHQLRVYEKIVDARLNLSNENDSQNDINAGLNNAKEFILKKQNKNGNWEDFGIIAGVSDIWATGFILTKISDLKSNFNSNSLKAACNYLMRNSKDGLWGYNTNWIADTDSTTVCLLALLLNGHDVDEAFEKWLSSQNENGSFSTYPDKKLLKQALNSEFINYDGWTSSHNCVSALAFYLLSRKSKTKSNIELLEKYLQSEVGKDYLWDSYWWTSGVYASSCICQALSFFKGNSIGVLVDETLKALSKNQSDEGYFIDGLGKPCAFYTALALSAYCSSHHYYSKYREHAKKAVKWLLKTQYVDGSYCSSFILQIPMPHIIDVREIDNWSNSLQFSTNVVVEDYNRLFSTSSVLKAFDD